MTSVNCILTGGIIAKFLKQNKESDNHIAA